MHLQDGGISLYSLPTMPRGKHLSAHKRDWEQLSQLDPLWAVMSWKEKRMGKWDPIEFFETGNKEVADFMSEASGLLPGRERMLDFGCGVGRLTQAFSAYFAEAHGVDIAEGMIRQAREFNPQCKFWVNATNDLSLFPDGHFDLVYSNIVLQHQPNAAVIRNYIAEFLRVLRTGGIAAFMVPTKKALRNRLNIKRTAFNTLAFLGASPGFLYRIGLHSMRMTGIPAKDVERLIDDNRATLISATPSASAHHGMFYMVRKS